VRWSSLFFLPVARRGNSENIDEMIFGQGQCGTHHKRGRARELLVGLFQGEEGGLTSLGPSCTLVAVDPQSTVRVVPQTNIFSLRVTNTLCLDTQLQEVVKFIFFCVYRGTFESKLILLRNRFNPPQQGLRRLS
jgi:hypothetical protein